MRDPWSAVIHHRFPLRRCRLVPLFLHRNAAIYSTGEIGELSFEGRVKGQHNVFFGHAGCDQAVRDSCFSNMGFSSQSGRVPELSGSRRSFSA
jgi:hypothetical protein